MEPFFETASKNMERAWEVIKETNIINIWESAGTEINLVGSLKTGLMMKHLDIDFHIYSSPLTLENSFPAIYALACNPSVKRLEYVNLIDTDEKCIEWHAWYLDKDNQTWQIDMIHLLKGSRYDGFMEQVAERILKALTPKTKESILRLKYDTPENEKIAGIEYYMAVLKDGIKSYSDFMQWRKEHPLTGVTEWMP